MSDNIKSIDRLADSIIQNRDFLNSNSFFNDGKRTILIIGAGASNEVASLPLGKELSNFLIKQLKCDDGILKIHFKNHLEQLNKEFGFDTDDFKTILFALNKIDSKSLVNLVSQALSIKVTSSDIYKSFASLLLNRSIDAIINFNFDEILDDEIDKVPSTQYFHKIISDNDLNDNSDLLDSSKLKFNYPIYIKPHGTISQPNTLRFQRNDFYKIQERTTQVLENIFSGQPVNIVVIGFRLKFYEFSTLISKCVSSGSNIYIVDKNEDILDPSLLKYYFDDFIKIDNSFSLADFTSILDNKLSFENDSILQESNLVEHRYSNSTYY